ncbi:MAG: hypothetical protein J6Q85_04420 [Clostridia bacterium]|nr:hypothetical protein [Clostridia bacterium]
MSAGDNEKNFRMRMTGNIKSKISFKHKDSKSNVYISVDGHFEYNGRLYLVEVDSGNEAKLLAGQYILLNSIYKQDVIEGRMYAPKDCVFLVIHFYNDYNVERTKNVLSFLKNKLNLEISFLAIHQENIKDWDCLISQL